LLLSKLNYSLIINGRKKTKTNNYNGYEITKMREITEIEQELRR